ncbi:LytTR family DNA-binding domain-containing protein [Devosia sp.]|uniref:LytTR family DNA-binding domain-containing protein n=1 Tax=Devosia sp. TaxID=1871048 RepID=UPI001AC376BA|nr:LytTR family DNA-binding domain-containing protein [Devosia sp.]MBN9308706.1 LytTR family transcriptional regulator [Devosia sp.]
MNRTALHSALREIRAHFSNLRVLGAMLVVAVVLALAGPFGTSDSMTLGARFAYWAAIVASSYGLAFSVSLLISHAFGLGRRITAVWARVLVFGAIAGVPVTLAVTLVNVIAYGRLPGDVLTLWAQCTLIGLCVMTMLEILDASIRQAAAEAPPAPAMPAQDAPAAPPAIVARLPHPQRGRLVSMSVADHYVEVTTEKGRGLVLIRLGDAMKEAGDVPGLQIHRSHWVALDAVRRLVRVDGKPMLELTDGRRLPVSRSHADAVRAAGFN